MLDDDAFDALYINFVTPFFVDTDSIAKEIAEDYKGKEVVLVGILKGVSFLLVDLARSYAYTGYLKMGQRNMAIINGIYLSSHNLFRGLPRAAGLT